MMTGGGRPGDPFRSRVNLARRKQGGMQKHLRQVARETKDVEAGLRIGRLLPRPTLGDGAP